MACPPRAQAVVSETVAIAIVAAYLASCGLSLAADGMNANGTTAAITKMVQDFLNTELGGVSIGEWSDTLFDAGVAIRGGAAYIPASAVNALAKFATWAKDKYGDTPGQSAVVSSDQSFTAVDGKTYSLSIDSDYSDHFNGITYYCSSFQVGTIIFEPPALKSDFSEVVIPVTSDVSFIFRLSSGYVYVYSSINSSQYIAHVYTYFSSSPPYNEINSDISFVINPQGYLTVGHVRYHVNQDELLYMYTNLSTGVKATDLNITGGSLSVGVTKGVSIPEVIGDQALQISTGNPDITTPEEFADDVIGSVIDGDLTADAEIVDVTDVPDVPVDPPVVEPTAPPIDVDIPDIDGLGLGALSAALVSRFPFSIPWDVAKGVELLAAPAKAPYWEVDLFEPIAYRVGGWKGDTTIVIDMSQFEIIGQLSRWTSTIGFCLILASGTKRLIWTA